MPHDYKFLQLDVDEGIALLTINRPEALNALSRDVLNELFSMFIQLRDDEAVRVVIVTGTGKAFIAGADIAYMKDQDAAGGERFAELGLAVLDLIEAMPKTVIAAVNGFALGGGTEFALACDLVYASEKAKFGQPEVKLGIIPGFGGTQRLPRLIGRNAAKEWIFTGDIYPASKAAELGLVQGLFAPEALLDGVQAVARKIAAAGPIAVARAKTAINQGQDLGLQSGLAIEKMSFAGLFTTEDRLEGMTAFVEKRPATFKNK